MRRIASRGMVQVEGVTYRVERLEPHQYAVVRLLDDVAMGTFCTLPSLRTYPRGCDDNLFAEIAKAALRFARTSGMMRAVTPPAPVAADQAPAAVQRSPSTMPPPVMA